MRRDTEPGTSAAPEGTSQTSSADEVAHVWPTIVGVGASAGGLESLKELFAHTPPDTGAAYVVIQHLAPDFESRMDQLIGRHTQLTVLNASSGLRLRPDTIYLVPPRKAVHIQDGVLELRSWATERESRHPIDAFFTLLAEAAGSRALAIVLSGSGSDGTLGARDIKTTGGLVFAQDSQSARFDDMPGSVAGAGCADFVIRPAAIARRIASMLRTTPPPPSLVVGDTGQDRTGTRPVGGSIVSSRSVLEADEICAAVASYFVTRSARAAVVLDEATRLLHVFGDAGSYVNAPHRTASYALGSAVVPELRLPIESALRRAAETREEVRLAGLRVDSGEPGHASEIRVVPLVGERGAQRYLVLFGEPTADAESESAIHTVEESVSRIRDLENEANNDPLTALLNRRGLAKVLRGQISQCQRNGTQLVAVLVDCDNFKQVNDEHGHAAGDAVLREVARRLAETLRPTDWVARIGGDEFLVLLPDTRIAEALHVAEKLRRRIAGDPIRTKEGVHRMTASFGAAALSPGVASIEEILQCTHDALARSKVRGKNRVQGSAEYVRGTPDSRADDRLVDVRAGHGFRTVVQPIWDLRANTVIGFEMLSRGPTGALEKPDDLFQLCMDTRILTEVDMLCLSRAVRGATRLEADRRVHVNLFPSTIMEADIEELISLFTSTGTPNRFCLEVSEQQLVGDPSSLVERTSRLKEHGIEIAVDDVGFGRSSLETLIVLEPDVIKIDRSMVTGVAGEPGLKRSLDRLMQVSRGLDARLIAEGIETREDRTTLLEMGVSAGQGFLWGKPYNLS